MIKIKNSILLVIVFFSNFIFSQKKGTIKTVENLKKDTANFASKKVDLNLDGKMDIIFYNKWNQGDDMYFFINDGKSYKLALKTINFNSDGSYKIEKIEPIKNNKDKIILKIHTLSYSKEDIKAIHFISYKMNHWYLQKTQYNAVIVDPVTDKLVSYKCLFKENTLLSHDINFEMFNSENKNCVKGFIK